MLSSHLTHEPESESIVSKQSKMQQPSLLDENPNETPAWRQQLETSIRENFTAYDVANYYVSLATIKAFGRPANRSIFFRGFLDDCPSYGKQQSKDRNIVVFTTDIRSSELQDLQHGSRFGEVCWFMQPKRHQFRISGQLHLILPPTHPLAHAAVPPSCSGSEDWEAVRAWYWKQISATRRASYSWADPGSPVIQSGKRALAPLSGSSSSSSPAASPPLNTVKSLNPQGEPLCDLAFKNFCLLLLCVDGCDFVNYSTVPYERTKYRKRDAHSYVECENYSLLENGWEIMHVNP